MNHTILIGDKHTFSMKTNRILWVFSGVLYIGTGIFQFYRYQDEGISYFVWILLILGGLYLIFFGVLGLSEKSKYAPKVALTDETIQIKKSFWKPAKQLKWNDITSINFKSYQIHFQFKKETYTFNYNSTADTSIEIKIAIRSFAESKGIEVVAG
jgi:hypothetical protein